MKLQYSFLSIAIVVGMLATSTVTVPTGGAGTCYVNDDATGGNTGTSWANAYTSLQSALADICTQIWVAAGIYKPHASDRTVSFTLESGTAVYGGFNGTETLLTQRDPVANITILSGDLNGDDSGFTNNSENSYHVVYASTLSSSAVLDGFTITAGNADGSFPDNGGGGLLNDIASHPTLANLIFSGNSADQQGGGMASQNSGNPALTNVIFSNNVADSGSGNGGGLAITINGTPTLTNVTFSGNSALLGGGMYLSNSANAVLMNVTFTNNTAATGAGGGGMYITQSNPMLTNVTFSANSAGAGSVGGGIYFNNNSNPTLTNVTFSGNSAGFSGGGIFNNNGSSPTLTNVIIANSIGGDCVNNFTSLNIASGNNLIEDAANACGLTNGVNGNIVGTDPGIGPLADNGDATLTHALLLGSAAIEAGTNTGCPATDQRGVTRPIGGYCDIGAVEAETLIVTNNNDSGAGSLRQALADANAGYTIGFDALLSGETITLTSTTLGMLESVTIDGSTLAAKITISGGGTLRVFYVGSGVSATLDSLIVTQGFVNGNGGGLLTDGMLSIINSRFSANTANNGGGGAIANNTTGLLTLTDSTISGNSAYNGGGIANYNQLTIANSTFAANTSDDVGGGIYNDSPIDHHNALTITNSTFSGNSATYGGGIWSEQPMTVRNSTFSGNVGQGVGDTGAGIWQEGAQLNYSNTIIANSLGGGGDCFVVSGVGTHTNNLVESGGNCASPLNVDPNLGPLADNGGATQTFALLANSPAIDAGDDATCANAPVSNLDQRGIARPNGGHCDIGAYEYVDTTAPTVTVFIVPSSPTTLDIPITDFDVSDDAILTGYLITESATPPTLGDPGWTASAPTTYPVASLGAYTLYPWAKDAAGHVSAVYGSPASVIITCLAPITVTSNADSGPGTLRQALADACVGDINNITLIDFDSALSDGTIHLASTLIISKNITLDGSDLAFPITLSGDSDNNGTGDVRVFSITGGSPGLTVTLDRLIVTKGATTGDGAGLFMEQGMHVTIKNSTFSDNHAGGNGGGIGDQGGLTLIDSTISGNSAAGTGGGGGISNESGATIANSTISNNSATGLGAGGGGLLNTGAGTIINSTFFGNSVSDGYGGGIMTTHNLTIKNSTIAGNTAAIAGGIDLQGNTTNLSNTIIAGNSASFSGNNEDCVNHGATIGTNTNNLIEDGSCSASLSGDPNLGALADNGGSTQTLALLPGSLAINAGDDLTCTTSPVNDLDQRGFTRTANGPHCDIGAYEYQDAVTPTVNSFTVISPSTTSHISITAFTASDNLTVTGYLITASSTPPSPDAAGWTGSAPTIYSVGSGGTYTLYPWAKDAAGNVSAVYGSPASVNVNYTLYLPLIRR